jgi:hypothetical protein
MYRCVRAPNRAMGSPGWRRSTPARRAG